MSKAAIQYIREHEWGSYNYCRECGMKESKGHSQKCKVSLALLSLNCTPKMSEVVEEDLSDGFKFKYYSSNVTFTGLSGDGFYINPGMFK